jgi:hypothetical protein
MKVVNSGLSKTEEEKLWNSAADQIKSAQNDIE